MPRTTPETLLISSILNTGDVYLGSSFGIKPEHFFGYQEHYRWVLHYYQQYGTCPTATELLTSFPNFPHDEEQNEARWAATEVKREYSRKDMRNRLIKASDFVRKNNIEDAFGVFEDLALDVVAQRPENVLVDPAFLDDYDAPKEKRVPVPWPTLQRYTNGIGPGELWYFAARQGRGKSSYLIDMAVNAAMAGHSTVIYSLEMTKRQTQVRAHAALGHRLGIKVNANAMLHRTWDPLAYKHLLGQIEERVPGSIMIHEVSMGMVTPAVIEARCGDYDLNIVDYAGLMRTNDGQPVIRDHRLMAEVSNMLKATALGKKTRIVAAAQINREGVGVGPNKWKPPQLHTLAQSDHLGNDGDVVVTMNRFGKGVAVQSIEKNRHGESDVYFYTKYDANHGDFAEVDRDEAEDIKEREEEY